MQDTGKTARMLAEAAAKAGDDGLFDNSQHGASRDALLAPLYKAGLTTVLLLCLSLA